MPDLLHVSYARTGSSTTSNELGMREMQARAYAKRNEQYLLIKSPPASGKSRALMFLALDKVRNQGIQKVLIAVPEMSIGASFKDTDLLSHGFFENWHIAPRYSLCTPGGDQGKVQRVVEFLDDPKAHYLLCTHATLRFAWERIRDKKETFARLNRALIAIDEFHHASEEDGNKLGAMLDDVMARSSAHIVAMTGSYFRGDAVPILSAQAEAKFAVVTYTYYEQLNGYKYLKTLGLGYHFYRGSYLDAIGDVLDPGKKTIVHIPSVNSRESSGKKLDELDKIVEKLGEVECQEADSGIYVVRTPDGRCLRVADLVTDSARRVDVLTYLRNIKGRDDVDIIIALGMAKEGFDWPWCEHVLTVGYRASLTEVVQIIGRATRDCEGKTHAQFTNLIAQPDASDQDVQIAVNNLLKALSLSLLMRDVLAPNIRFRPRSSLLPGEKTDPDTIVIDDTKHPLSPRLKQILENDGVEALTQKLLTSTAQNKPLQKAIVSDDQRELFSQGLLQLIQSSFPDLDGEEQQVLRHVLIVKLETELGSAGTATGTGNAAEGGAKETDQDAGSEGQTGDPGTREETGTETPPPVPSITVIPGKDDKEEKPGGSRLLDALRYLDVSELNIDLIGAINPFHQAYEILSKQMDAPTLKAIQDAVQTSRSAVTEQEALNLWQDVQKFVREQRREPDLSSLDDYERRLAEVLVFIRRAKARKMQEARAAQNSQAVQNGTDAS